MDVHSSSWELYWTSNANLGLSGQATNNLTVRNPRHISHSLKNDSLISFLLFLLLCFAASEASYYGPYKENYLRAGFAGPLLSRGPSAYIRVCIPASVLFRGVFFLLTANPWSEMAAEQFTDVHLYPQEVVAQAWLGETISVVLKCLYLLVPELSGRGQ